MNADAARQTPHPYSDPYLAGIGLGLVLLAAFVIVGRGLGASGGFAAIAASTVSAVAPETARGSAYIIDHLTPIGPFGDWLVLELVGVIAGAWLSARLAGRLAVRVERPDEESTRARIGTALVGGSLMGGGAVLARGCTSGQALTGGALLSVGSWAFIVAAFAAAYATAFLRPRSWR